MAASCQHNRSSVLDTTPISAVGGNHISSACAFVRTWLQSSPVALQHQNLRNGTSLILQKLCANSPKSHYRFSRSSMKNSKRLRFRVKTTVGVQRDSPALIWPWVSALAEVRCASATHQRSPSQKNLCSPALFLLCRNLDITEWL